VNIPLIIAKIERFEKKLSIRSGLSSTGEFESTFPAFGPEGSTKTKANGLIPAHIVTNASASRQFAQRIVKAHNRLRGSPRRGQLRKDRQDNPAMAQHMAHGRSRPAPQRQAVRLPVTDLR